MLVAVIATCLGLCGCGGGAAVENRIREDAPKTAGVCKYGHKNREECYRFAYQKIAKECGEDWAMVIMREWGWNRENCDDMEPDD